MNKTLSTRLYNIYYSQSNIYCYGLDYVLRLRIAQQWPLATSLLSEEIKNEFINWSLRDQRKRSV